LIKKNKLKIDNRYTTLKYGWWAPWPVKGDDVELSSMMNLLRWSRMNYFPLPLKQRR
jgi:hypothetical protein